MGIREAWDDGDGWLGRIVIWTFGFVMIALGLLGWIVSP